MRIVGSTILALLLLVGTAFAEERFDVFFVVVGSGHYVVPKQDGVKGMQSIPGAVKSAKAVADLLERGGSTFGVTLFSDNSHFVSRADVSEALSRVYDEIAKTHPARPLIVFYFAGHGISEGMAWNHFSLPGDFAYRGDLSSIVSRQVSELESTTIHAGVWVALMTERKLPFLVLLDTCYEGQADEFVWKPMIPPDDKTDCSSDISGFCAALGKRLGPGREFDKQMAETTKSLNKMAASLRSANRFENTNPVLFSAEPGSVVKTVSDPFNSDPRATAVAPLARRVMLILTPVLKRRQSISFEAFIQEMKSPALDGDTKPAVSYSRMPAYAGLLLVNAASPRGRSESRVGTAVVPAICCSQPKDPAPSVSPTPQ